MVQLTHIGLRPGIGGSVGGAAVWTPLDLGASLLGWWAAEDLSATPVSSWVDRIGAYDCTAAAGERPAWSATGWNSVAPGVTFDGTANFLTLASQPFPSGSATASIWGVVDQTALVADTTTRMIASYGGDTAGTQRRLSRRVVTGANVLTSQAATTTADATGDFSGRHLARGLYTPTGIYAGLDGNMSVVAAIVPATGTTRFRIGATSAAVAANLFQGAIRHLLVTAALTSGQVTQLNAWGASQL